MTLEQVYGAIALYLANQETIDAYLKESEVQFEQVRQIAIKQHTSLHKKLATAKAQLK